MVEKLKKNLILIAIIAGIFVAGAIFYKRPGKLPGILSPREAAERAIRYINENILEGQTASLLNTIEESGVYKFRLKIGEREFESYVTKDGKILFIQGINLEEKLAQKKPERPQEIPKKEKPDIKLFVMSYCPFGLQMQKAFLPVYSLLKEKAQMGVYFVDYIMHEKQEMDENLRQYCIQKEQKEKYYDYLNCFVKDGDFEKCLLEAKIDKEKMNSCITQTDKDYKITQLYEDKSTWLNGRFPRFNVHKDLNEKYGVEGSPTLVINDRIVEVERSPEKLKEAICNSFLNPPSECQKKLSETSFSPGFGFKEGEGEGQCR